MGGAGKSGNKVQQWIYTCFPLFTDFTLFGAGQFVYTLFTSYMYSTLTYAPGFPLISPSPTHLPLGLPIVDRTRTASH